MVPRNERDKQPMTSRKSGLTVLGEFGLIASIERRAGQHTHVRLGIGDDAAALTLDPGHELLATADLLVQDVHFRTQTATAHQIGRKSVAVNISDLAAMGAKPLGLLASLAIPSATPLKWIEQFRDGLLEAAAVYGAPLVGGDTTSSPGPIVINITALGSALATQTLTRGGARPGDALWLAGNVGLARAGLEALEAGVRGFSASKSAHKEPQALLKYGMALAACGRCSACIDVSDGLLGDLAHIVARSRVGVELDEASLPIHPEVRRWAKRIGADVIDYVLNGGEDYALAFALHDTRKAPLLSTGDTPALVRIGRVTDTGALTLRRADGCLENVQPRGFVHF
jgi:thiamine-monophosphate kinase